MSDILLMLGFLKLQVCEPCVDLKKRETRIEMILNSLSESSVCHMLRTTDLESSNKEKVNFREKNVSQVGMMVRVKSYWDTG